MLAVKADAYSNGKDTLTLTFHNSDKSKTTLPDLTGDLLIANASLLKAICEQWVSVTLDSTFQQEVSVQILVVWTL